MINNYFHGSPRMFSNNITMSPFTGEPRIQLSILLEDSTNLRKGLVQNEPKLKIAAKNQRSIIIILKAEEVHIRPRYIHTGQNRA
jgi:hypothetical protein